MWSDFIEAMRNALSLSKEAGDSGSNPARLALLPGLCCESAGGNIRRADKVAAAWILFYIAADIMDSVEDGDTPEPWWQGLGSGLAINVASGLFFSASSLLTQLLQDKSTISAAADIHGCFNSNFLLMCGGQHRDLIREEPSLEQYWESVSAKSGKFFQIACQAGARLATDDRFQISGYADFGLHLGILIQVLDDLEDFFLLQRGDLANPSAILQKSIALAYAREVLTGNTRAQLFECMRNLDCDQSAAEKIIGILDESGVVIYILAEIERHRRIAINRLQHVSPHSAPTQKLISIIQNLGANIP